jgi:hypothetical protein
LPVQIKIAVVRKGPDIGGRRRLHMRRAAMDQGKKLGEIAQALLTAADLLK